MVISCVGSAPPIVHLEVVQYMFDFGQNGFPEVMSLVGAALLASTLILVFFYLFAVLFRNEKSIAWVKMELYELVSTVIIIMMVIALIGFLSSNSLGTKLFFTKNQIKSMSDEQGINMYDLSANYFENVKYKLTTWMCFDLFAGAITDQGSTQFNVHPHGQGFSAQPLAGFFAPIKLVLNNALIAMTISYVVNMAMYTIMKYSIIAFSTYILPLGILFRAIEPTRKFGGTLIALSIAFLIIYPMLISISYYMTNNLQIGAGTIQQLSDTDSTTNSKLNESFKGGIKGVMGKIWNIISTPTELVKGPIILIEAIMLGFSELFGSVLMWVLFKLMGGILTWAALVGFIIPAFNTVILIYSTKSLSKSLGANVDITSLTRVI